MIVKVWIICILWIVWHGKIQSHYIRQIHNNRNTHRLMMATSLKAFEDGLNDETIDSSLVESIKALFKAQDTVVFNISDSVNARAYAYIPCSIVQGGVIRVLAPKSLSQDLKEQISYLMQFVKDGKKPKVENRLRELYKSAY